jgi:hypothetical protein
MSPEKKAAAARNGAASAEKGHVGKRLDLDGPIFMGWKEPTIESSRSR